MKQASRMLVIMCALALPSCSSMKSKPEATAGPAVSGTLGEQAITMTATVKKIDLKNRRVTLEGPSGKPVTVTVSDAVRNLPQVKVGDVVAATYYQSVAYEVKKPGEATPGVSVAEGAERAKLGERPGGGAARVTTITATITGIDKSNGTVTLTGPDGDPVTVKARNPDNLNKVKTGDLVEITLTEALAIDVHPASK